MSVSSTMSDMSVSYNGSEMPLSDALDECFTELQGFMNSTHCYVRELGAMGEQDNDYEEGLKKVLVIGDTIDSMSNLFKELKSVTKQVLGTPPKDEKEKMKKIINDHKDEKKRQKEIEKENK